MQLLGDAAHLNATGSSPGAAASFAADDDGGFTPRWRLADFNVDRAYSPAATNAATTRTHNTAETSPTTGPTASLIATTATSTSAGTASARRSITPLLRPVSSAWAQRARA